MKEALRHNLRKRRTIFVHQNSRNNLLEQFLQHIPLPPTPFCMAGYIPMRDEIDPQPLMHYAYSQGNTLCLPMIRPNGKPMLFGRYTPDAPLVRGRFGNQEPYPNAATVIPDVVLLPLLGFDRQGHRLGQGGGAYDTTLSYLLPHHSMLCIGIGWSCQEEPIIPTESHDISLDWILTECEAIPTGRKLS